MRNRQVWWQGLLVLAAVLPATGFNGCVADLLREASDALNQAAYELDGKPQTLGQWWDSLWNGDHRSGSNAEDFDDWWEDLWD